MTDIRGTVKNKTILSARDVENQKKDIEDDPNFKTGFKHSGASKIKDQTNILLRDSQGKTQTYKVETGSKEGSEILALKDPENS